MARTRFGPESGDSNCMHHAKTRIIDESFYEISAVQDTHDARATGRKEVKVVNMRVHPPSEVTILRRR